MPSSHYPNRTDVMLVPTPGTFEHPTVALTEEAISRSGKWLGLPSTSQKRRESQGRVRTASLLRDKRASYVGYVMLHRYSAPTNAPIRSLDPMQYGLLLHPLGWVLGAHSTSPPALVLPRTRTPSLRGIPWYPRGTLLTFHGGTPNEYRALVLSIDAVNERYGLPIFLGCAVYPTSGFAGPVPADLGAVCVPCDNVDYYALPTHTNLRGRSGSG